jgi:hypothetical protein
MVLKGNATHKEQAETEDPEFFNLETDLERSPAVYTCNKFLCVYHKMADLLALRANAKYHWTPKDKRLKLSGQTEVCQDIRYSSPQ